MHNRLNMPQVNLRTGQTNTTTASPVKAREQNPKALRCESPHR